MADYWKSQPRKFCQYCKCWIADNKPSRDFHERGKNHQENVAAKFAEIKKKSIDKLKQEERTSKEFAAMEEAAMKAYQEDLKRMGLEAAGYDTPVQAKSTKQPLPLVGPPPKAQPKQQQQQKQQQHKKGGRGGKKYARPPPGRQTWVEGQAEDGTTYFYNTETGESRWDNPGAAPTDDWVAASQPEQNEKSSGGDWVEAVSPEGYPYYYNTETGESSWERPNCAPSDGAAPGSSGAEASQEEEPSATRPEVLAGEEEEDEEKEEEEGGPGGSPAPQDAGVSERADSRQQRQPKVAKIRFGKRKAEAEPPERLGEGGAGDGEEAREAKGRAEVPSAAAPAADRSERDAAPAVAPAVPAAAAKKPKAANPYGSWERVGKDGKDEKDEDPYANVDLQLPRVAGVPAKAAKAKGADLPPEPRPKFRERVVTSLGAEGGPAAFRKSKAPGGKSRSLRQRDADDE